MDSFRTYHKTKKRAVNLNLQAAQDEANKALTVWTEELAKTQAGLVTAGAELKKFRSIAENRVKDELQRQTEADLSSGEGNVGRKRADLVSAQVMASLGLNFGPDREDDKMGGAKMADAMQRLLGRLLWVKI